MCCYPKGMTALTSHHHRSITGVNLAGVHIIRGSSKVVLYKIMRTDFNIALLNRLPILINSSYRFYAVTLTYIYIYLVYPAEQRLS